jgi:DNA-nicking Smr family endonuclease
MSRRRQLSDEDRELWAGLTRSIKPLRQRRRSVRKPEQSPVLSSPAAAESHDARAPSAAKSRPINPQNTAAPAALDRRAKQRVARGRDPLDARIDLHGMTQTQAHAALLNFLHRAQAQGARMVLIVTGKGSGRTTADNDDTVARGVLKRQVPLWLALPDFRPLVAAFDEAHTGHGGQGALYVRVRRAK